ncbi:hypothetical protein SA3096_10810 [Aggregatibacter actinomycetemcomitans serotype e str. SA3096]|nr:hypothetical protein SA3096_10810 [Aggregatibacter actinomycetemcomitans serotype e str. SA3096]
MTITKKAIILSFLSGFLSLGLEVIWIRLFGFYGLSLPQIFSLTLALFFIGYRLWFFNWQAFMSIRKRNHSIYWVFFSAIFNF